MFVWAFFFFSLIHLYSTKLAVLWNNTKSNRYLQSWAPAKWKVALLPLFRKKSSGAISYADFASSLLRKVCSTACLLKATRVDIVFDTCTNLSIKSFEHKRIESDSFSFHRRIVNPQQRISLQWEKCLSNDENKKKHWVFAQLINKCMFGRVCMPTNAVARANKVRG